MEGKIKLYPIGVQNVNLWGEKKEPHLSAVHKRTGKSQESLEVFVALNVFLFMVSYRSKYSMKFMLDYIGYSTMSQT